MTPSLPPSPPVANTSRRILQAWRNLHAHRKGQAAEIIALLYFLSRGYRPAPRPWRALAQTDLLLRKGHLLVMVEVKARSSREKASFALTPQQKQRLARQQNALAARYPHLTTRLDLLLIYPHRPFLTHIANI